MRRTEQPNVQLPQLDVQQYTVALICPLSIELTAARLMFDVQHKTPPLNITVDDNTYTCGSISGHNVVIASLPQWHNGPISAAHLINPMTQSFPNLRATLLVGIGGGIPQKHPASDSCDDIRLGDVVVGWDGDKRQSVIHWESRSILPQPDRWILNVLTKLESNRDIGATAFPEHLKRCTQHSSANRRFAYPGLQNDKLYEPNHHHMPTRGPSCDACGSDRIVRREERKTEEFQLHFGRIACVDRVVDDSERRDQIRDEVHAICVEMEAAGILGRQNCLVIRGISDYADSHKNEVWKGYAAATAAAVVREILYTMDPGEVNGLPVHDSSKSSTEDRAKLINTKAQRVEDTSEWIATNGTYPQKLRSESPYFPSQLLLAHDQVALGDLVLSKDTPWNDFRPYPKRLHPHVDFVRSTPQLNEVLGNISGSQRSGNVGTLFKAAIASSQTSAQALRAMQSNCVRLKNSGDKFEMGFLGTDDIVKRATGRAIFGQIADANVKRWLEKQMIERNRNAYMIVGIYTLSDAQIAQIRRMAQVGGMEFNAPEPVNRVARSGAGQLVVGEGAIVPPGNQIYALEYRQVRLKRHIRSALRKDKIEEALLSKTNVWKIYGGGEGQRVDLGDETNLPSVPGDEDEDDSEEYLEADLVDELEPLEIEEIEV